jgi:hypothetical protein
VSTTPKKTAAKKTTPPPAKFGGRGANAAAARRAAAVANGTAKARRSDEEEPESPLEGLEEAAEAAVAVPAEPQVPHQVAPAPLEGIVQPREPADPFEYVPAPDDVSDLQHLAHAERQIRKIGEAAGSGFAEIEKNYWTLTGRWLAEVQAKGSYKAGGYKSVEKFAHSIGMERHAYYRAIKHHVVYTALDGLLAEPLAQNVVDQLYSLGKDDSELLRSKYIELAKKGPVTVSAVKNLRRLMEASTLAAREPKEITARQPRPIADRLKEARAVGRLDLGIVQELVKAGDRQTAQEYVEDMKKRVAEAEGLLAS